MRIFEFDNDMTRLAEAVEAWIELSHSPEDIKMILNHRFSQQFKTTSAKTAYRVVFADYEAFKETGKVSLPNREDGFVAYSLASSWGASARDDFDYNGDMIRFKKKFQAGSVLLNFSALASALRKYTPWKKPKK